MARRKDSPLPQSLKQPQSSSSGGRRGGSSKPGRRRHRASRGRVLSGPLPPWPPETPVIFGFINADLPLPSLPVNTEGVGAKGAEGTGGKGPVLTRQREHAAASSLPSEVRGHLSHHLVYLPGKGNSSPSSTRTWRSTL